MSCVNKLVEEEPSRHFAALVMRVCLVWRLCATNADGSYGCRSSLVLFHTLEDTIGDEENFNLQMYKMCISKQEDENTFLL